MESLLDLLQQVQQQRLENGKLNTNFFSSIL